MTIRDTFSAVAFTALLFAPGLGAQVISLKRPDSLARPYLPADPAGFVRLVAERERSVADLFFDAGCPADGGWAAAAFTAIEAAARTDPTVRGALAQTLGTELAFATGRVRGILNPVEAQCPADLPRFEAWLVAELRREWESGRLAGMNKMAVELFKDLQSARTPEAYALLRGIALDPGVYNETDRGAAPDGWNWDQRSDAAYAMASYRQRALGEGRLDALQAVLFELAALPSGHFDGYAWQKLFDARGEAFRQEYDEVLKAAGRGR